MWAKAGLSGAVVLAYFLSRKRYQDVFTPLFVYILIWCSCIFLFRLRLVNYDELESHTIIVIVTSMVAFVSGCLAAGRARSSGLSSFKIVLPRLEKAIRILILVNLTGLLFFAVRMARTFGIFAYFSDPKVIRVNYEDLGRLGVLALLLLVNYPLFTCSLIHFLKSTKLRWFSAVGLSLPVVQGYLTMSRNSMAIPVATGLFVWCYFRGWRTLNRKILTRAALMLGLIAAYFILVGLWYGKLASSENSAYKQSDFNVSSQVAFQFVDPYIYATAEFPAFQAAIRDVHGRLWGVRTFFPIARLLYGLGLISRRPENARLEYYFVPIPFNTYTYLFGFYEDFGPLGLVLFPFLIGWFGTKLYLQMRERPSIFSVGGTAAFMVVILYSVFISLGSTLHVWYYLLLLFVISLQCTVMTQNASV